MEHTELDDLVALLPPLLGSMEALGFIGRHFHPPHFAELMAAVGEPDLRLREALARLEAWPEQLAGVSESLRAASREALAAFEGLRAAAAAANSLRAGFRALGHASRASEALYPLAADLPPVSRFFLEPARRDDRELQARMAQAPQAEITGVLHSSNGRDERGGWSAYCPEDYAPQRSWPLVMALHGGSGHGRAFLFSWLRAARTHGAIVVAPTAVGSTWALRDPGVDTSNLAEILGEARARWNIDASRVLLTGLSDGGTFSYVSGLEGGSPFTHLAPIAAAFHPMLAQMADPERIGGLPIFVIHGALDWMFDIALARQARTSLAAAGAQVTYRELADLSHTYPTEMNSEILNWLDSG